MFHISHSAANKASKFPCFLSKSTIELQAQKGEENNNNNTKQNMNLDARLELV